MSDLEKNQDPGEIEENDPYAGMPREPIPEVLHSFYEDRAFKCCTRCGETLADFKDGYKVSKNFKQGEVIIEYALCMPCLENMMNEASEESRRVLDEYHRKHFRNVSGFDECALCEKTRESARGEEFGLSGICQGGDMLDSAMICIDCMETMAEIISDETRGKWNRFREENFPGVPGDFEPMPNKPTPMPL